MKRVVWAAAIIAAIILYSAASPFILKKQNKKLIDSLDLITKLYEQDKSAAEAAAELTADWRSYRKKMSFIIDDEKLCELDTAIAKIPPYISEANDELEAELENVRRRLNTIYRSEIPYWYNIL